MAVSGEDVRHVARLARLGLDPARVDALVQELNGILSHMDVLRAAGTGAPADAAGNALAGATVAAMPLRPDAGPQLPLERALGDFAPDERDGFFVVPRLATHDGDAERSP